MGGQWSRPDRELIESRLTKAIIDLRSARLSDADVEYVLDRIKRDRRRGITLLLDNTKLSSVSIELLCCLMRDNANCIASLSLHSNSIGQSDAIRICNALQVSQLTTLDIDAIGLTESGLCALGRALPQSSIRHLSISDNRQRAPHASWRGFAQGLPHSQIESLQLNDNDLADEEVVELVRSLPLCANLVAVSLAGNHCHVYGTRALAKALVDLRCQIRSIDLSRNRINADGAASLAGMIVQNTTLTHIDLSANPLTECGVNRLIASAESNLTLTTFLLPLAELHGFNSTTSDRLQQIMQRNRRTALPMSVMPPNGRPHAAA